MRLTNTGSWREAQQKYPTSTTVAKLEKFAHLDFRHSAPDVFKTYCQSVMDSQIPAEGNVMKIGGVRVAVVSGNFSSLSAKDIKDVDSVFSGASLIIAACSKVCLILHSYHGGFYHDYIYLQDVTSDDMSKMA